MNNKGIFDAIRKIVMTIPEGKVCTYGQVAGSVGINNPRIVGWALRGNQNPLIPCHRVVQKNGTLAKNFSLGGWQEQKRRLEKDGVTFISENQVDMTKHSYSILPIN
jgi:methylated-DNA-protein-cysteine methyltransferase-like protein